MEGEYRRKNSRRQQKMHRVRRRPPEQLSAVIGSGEVDRVRVESLHWLQNRAVEGLRCKDAAVGTFRSGQTGGARTEWMTKPACNFS